MQNELQNLLEAHHEWLLIDAAGKSFALRKTEFELSFERGKMLFGFVDDKGFQTWRVASLRTKADEILLNLTRNFERDWTNVRLVPRALAKDLSASVELARLEKANGIARLITGQFPRARLVRASLNKENGRFAQIVFEDLRKLQTAALGDVSESLTPEIMISAALLWLTRLARRKRNPVDTIWLLAETAPAKKLQKLHALLRDAWKSKIIIKEISRKDLSGQSEDAIKDLPALKISDLWRGKARRSQPAEEPQPSGAALGIIELAPGAIDVVFSRRGETLRFNGLPFARVRKVLGREKVWFGVENRQPLTADNAEEFAELIENLRVFRAADSPNKRHAFYRLAPEAWLEAGLRRNIRLLDANLILAPLYHQFRTGRERVDLLALRRDGRLVIIELKTEADRAAPFQLAGYWRSVERERRCGNLRNARLFGELEIAAAPAICYLVAPTLAFHRDFEFLAGALSEEIEIHRFNLAENWRARLKVLERR